MQGSTGANGGAPEENHSDSADEQDGKQRSTKRMKKTIMVKDTPVQPQMDFDTGKQQGRWMPSTNQPSYKEKLAGVIPGAFAEAFHIDECMGEDSDDDTCLQQRRMGYQEGC